MADTLRIGRKEATDEVTRVPDGESTEDEKIAPGAVNKNGRPASYRLQVFTPPAVEGKALWGTFGAEAQDDTPAPSEAPTRRVRYVRSMRRPVLAIATGAIAALVFLLGLLVYTKVRTPEGDGKAESLVAPSSREPLFAVTSAKRPTPEALRATPAQHSATEPTHEEPSVPVAPAPLRRTGRRSLQSSPSCRQPAPLAAPRLHHPHGFPMPGPQQPLFNPSRPLRA